MRMRISILALVSAHLLAVARAGALVNGSFEAPGPYSSADAAGWQTLPLVEWYRVHEATAPDGEWVLRCDPNNAAPLPTWTSNEAMISAGGTR